MIPIIKWTLWQRRYSLFWWSVCISAFNFINTVFYPTFKDQAAELQKSFENLPDAALQLFGGSADFFSPVGFLNSQIFFLMLPLLLTMMMISLASSLLAREEQDMTIELLLARPISRAKVLLAKVTAGTLFAVAVTLVVTGVTILCAAAFNIDVPLSSIALACLNCLLLAYATAAISFLLTATGRARGAALGIGALVGVGGYLVTSLSGTVTWLKGPSNFLPFEYYQSEAILRGTYHWVNALFFVGVIAACCVLSWIGFRRRDIS